MANAWLARQSGSMAGRRYLIRGEVTRVGRGTDNDIVVDEAATVSAHHLEIRNAEGAYKICDLNSTNGTFVNGNRITEASLEADDSIQIGATGPAFTFILDDLPAVDTDPAATLIAKAPGIIRRDPTELPIAGAHEELLTQAIARARLARHKGIGDQTMFIMREMLHGALHHTRRRFKKVIVALVAMLIVVSTFGYWKIQSLRKEKRHIDAQIATIEELLEKAGLTERETDQLAERLDQYENQARALQTTLLYKVSAPQPEDPVEVEIKSLMAEFGAETYAVPPEFLEQVKRFVARYQGPDRPHMVAALGRSRKDVTTIQSILQEAHLPPDLAYMAVVESALGSTNRSSAGAVGAWQFTPVTAKTYGLRIGQGVDERLDIRKSTQAACKLLRDLILDFGSGSSVMLALAAYNSGTARVKQEIRKVSDPIKQRNFWYLYRVRALPTETREYVPKVIAAIIIARNPSEFGF